MIWFTILIGLGLSFREISQGVSFCGRLKNALKRVHNWKLCFYGLALALRQQQRNINSFSSQPAPLSFLLYISPVVVWLSELLWKAISLLGQKVLKRLFAVHFECGNVRSRKWFATASHQPCSLLVRYARQLTNKKKVLP